MFAQLVETVDREAVEMIFRLQLASPPPETAQADTSRMKAVHEEASAMGYGGVDEESRTAGKKQPVKRSTQKVGRNDPCPCGSGKKYKKCCGAASA